MSPRAEAPPHDGGLAELHLTPNDAVLALYGEVDLANLDQVTAALDAVLATPARALVVDLDELDFASVSTLSALVGAAHAMVGRDGEMTVTGVRSLHRRVLELLGAPSGLVVAGPHEG